MEIFRHSALESLGILVSNFSSPDVSKEDSLDHYSYLVASYLYPKAFSESPAGEIDDGALVKGFSFKKGEYGCDDMDDSFLDCVKENFYNYYGSFITRYLMDMSAVLAPMIRILEGELFKIIFNSCGKKYEDLIKEADTFIEDCLCTEDTEDRSHILEWAVADHDSLLFTLLLCNELSDRKNIKEEIENSKTQKFVSRFFNKKVSNKSFLSLKDIIKIYYVCRYKSSYWSDSLKEISKFSYESEMPRLCDVANQEIGIFSAFSQLSYPFHANVHKVKRYKYIAEGKRRPMFMDIIPFDECRYVYDWLSSVHLIPDYWNDMSKQLIFRFALDGIVKQKDSYSNDFLFGCHVVGKNRISESILSKREDIQ